MTMKKNSFAAIVLATAAVAMPAFAQQGQGAAYTPGGYVGLNLGQSDWHAGGGVNGVTGDSNGTSYKLYGGYQFLPNWAVEIGYVDFGKFEGTGSAKAHGAYADIVGILPLTSDWSLFGRVGAVDSRVHTTLAGVDSSDSGTDWKAGVGAQYSLTRNLSVRAELERYRVKGFGTRNTDLASVGLAWKF